MTPQRPWMPDGWPGLQSSRAEDSGEVKEYVGATRSSPHGCPNCTTDWVYRGQRQRPHEPSNAEEYGPPGPGASALTEQGDLLSRLWKDLR